MRSRKGLVGLAAISAIALLVAVVPAAGAKSKKDIRSRPLALTAVDLPKEVAAIPEPSVAISKQDTLFICGPGGLLGGQALIVRSTDWVHFEDKTISDPGAGGDCDIKVGPDNAIYTANLQGFGSFIRKSTDDGKSFDQMWQEPVEEDRQWLYADPKNKNVVYFGYHDLTAEAEIVAKSTDGGQSFVQHMVASTDPGLAADTYPNTFSGPVRVDPSNTDRVYITYAISSAQSNVTQDSRPFGMPEKVIVAASDDGGLSWTDHVVMSGPPGSVIGNLFPWLTIDQAGNLYSIAAGHTGVDSKTNGLFVSYSTDHAKTWSKPLKVNIGKGATAFPTAVAGKDGVLDVAWIEDSLPDFSDPKSVWSIHFAQSRNAHSKHPKYAEVAGPVIRNGPVCVLGTLCSGNRELADFFEITLDSFGYAHMAVTSTVGGKIDPDTKGEDDSNLHVLYWRQDAGPSAYSEPCANKGKKRGRCVTSRPLPSG